MASRVTAEATSVAQLKAGTRRRVMPSVRSTATVVNRLADASRKPAEMRARLMIHRLVAALAPPAMWAMGVDCDDAARR